MMDQGIEEGMCNQVTQVARSTGKVSSGNQYRFRQIKKKLPFSEPRFFPFIQNTLQGVEKCKHPLLHFLRPKF